MNPFDTVHEFERQIAEYTGAPYATATDCCTHALYMCLYWHKKRMGIQHIVLPKNTYVSVAMQAIHLGLDVQFDQIAWSGAYDIGNTNVVDAAARLYKGCYQPGKQQCLSFQFKKILSTDSRSNISGKEIQDPIQEVWALVTTSELANPLL